ncbi:MFS domain-containing protein [Aphelenchoides besseyi]|nr:MFS domain-containing protein [Aphelenchoides besseyi]
MRFVQGMSYGGNFPAIGYLCSKWSSLKQNGFCASILTSYGPLSLGISNAVGGIVIMFHNRMAIGLFFAHAAATVFLLVWWVILFDDEPALSRKVSAIELEKIQRNKSAAHINGKQRTPYRTLITDIIVITVWVNVLVETFANNVLAVYSPYIISNVLHYGVLETGYFSAICLIAQIPVRMLCGYLSDNIKFLSDDTKLIFFNTLSLGGAGTIYLSLGFLSADNPLLIVVLFTCVSLCTGASSCGFVRAAIDYGRQYSNFILGACQLMKSITLYFVPALAGLLVTAADSADQWKILYFGTAIALYLANLMFWRYATSKPAPYTEDGYFDDKSQRED